MGTSSNESTIAFCAVSVRENAGEIITPRGQTPHSSGVAVARMDLRDGEKV